MKNLEDKIRPNPTTVRLGLKIRNLYHFKTQPSINPPAQEFLPVLNDKTD